MGAMTEARKKTSTAWPFTEYNPTPANGWLWEVLCSTVQAAGIYATELLCAMGIDRGYRDWSFTKL